MALWAEALAILRTYLFGAEDHIEAQVARFAGDHVAQAHWRLIGKRIALVREAAAKDEPDAS